MNFQILRSQVAIWHSSYLPVQVVDTVEEAVDFILTKECNSWSFYTHTFFPKVIIILESVGSEKKNTKERETTIRVKVKVIGKYLFKINRNNVPVPWPYRDVGYSTSWKTISPIWRTGLGSFSWECNSPFLRGETGRIQFWFKTSFIMGGWNLHYSALVSLMSLTLDVCQTSIHLQITLCIITWLHIASKVAPSEDPQNPIC